MVSNIMSSCLHRLSKVVPLNRSFYILLSVLQNGLGIHDVVFNGFSLAYQNENSAQQEWTSYSTLLCPILFLERNKICLNQNSVDDVRSEAHDTPYGFPRPRSRVWSASVPCIHYTIMPET